MIPTELQHFLDKALPQFQNDTRYVGVAVAGSWLSGELDRFSDLDLVLVTDPAHHPATVRDAGTIARALAPCLATFPGDHLGLPNIQICLFADPLLHVDLKFVSLDDFPQRTENPQVLWERDNALTSVIEKTKPQENPDLPLQWLEDRFWTWIHYAAQRLGRGELFEVIDMLTFLRSRVLGTLLAEKSGRPARGVRRLDQYARDDLEALRATVPSYDAHSCEHALRATAKLYLDLRETVASDQLQRNRRAEMATLRYLHEVSEQLPLP